ncbi:MAG: DUF1972 domain-containing protein [Gammaproteobacteria bacterium]|nr:DUF1972 domain-containing protein [Pseudomonadales bacterium]
MKIAILGTRGIPNNYGGCEANAEMLSPIFLEKGHDVTVYCSSEHLHQQPTWNGVELKHIYCPESRFGIWGTLLYDFLCLQDALKSEFDIVVELGYVPVALFYPFFRRRNSLLFTNMDGLEWKRSKWNWLLRKFTLFTEYLGAHYSDALIADNIAIQEHLKSAYQQDSYFIAYGAESISKPDPGVLIKYDLQANEFFMLIARLEPENNIEMILEGYCQSESEKIMIVVGSTSTKFGQQLTRRFSSFEKIRFLESIYDYADLSSLRWYCSCYFHGHSVGGTNPSLLEAMATNAFIAIHANAFNETVVGDGALRFSTAAEVAAIMRRRDFPEKDKFLAGNRQRITEEYTWENCAQQHLDAFESEILKCPV